MYTEVKAKFPGGVGEVEGEAPLSTLPSGNALRTLELGTVSGEFVHKVKSNQDIFSLYILIISYSMCILIYVHSLYWTHMVILKFIFLFPNTYNKINSVLFYPIPLSHHCKSHFKKMFPFLSVHLVSSHTTGVLPYQAASNIWYKSLLPENLKFLETNEGLTTCSCFPFKIYALTPHLVLVNEVCSCSKSG